MDFQKLLAKMVELDQLTPETSVSEGSFKRELYDAAVKMSREQFLSKYGDEYGYFWDDANKGMGEGNEFSGALVKAKAAGEKEFEVDGKTYKVKEDGTTEACGDAMPSPMMDKSSTPPPSMTVNLNAQGMDDISELMKLMTKVNPDMINQPQGGMPPMPGVAVMPKISSIGDLGNLDSGPLKMLPDMDAGNDKMPGGEMDLPPGHDKDHDMIKTLDKDMDGDHDMDDHDNEKKKEAFANSVGDLDAGYMGMDAAFPKGNDLHKSKSMHRAAAGGDNAMRAEGADLRAQIRAELQQRLAEAKGAK